jgi:DNA-binding XRE family transcriptional regulator
MTEITTRVGRYKVKDGSAAVKVDPSGNVTLTMRQWLGYERRAAHVVFVDAPEVGGNELKFARKALALTQAELGERLDVSKFTVCDWEGGKPVTRTVQLAIASLLEKALRGPAWPPTAWVEAEPKRRPSCFEVPRRRKTG